MGNIKSVTKVEDDEETIRKFSHFDPEDIKRWSSSFSKSFLNSKITKIELENIFKIFFPFGDPKRFSNILFNTINISGTDFIDFHEMLIAFSILSKGSAFEKLRWIFRLYDCDNDGVVSKNEMVLVAEALYEMTGNTLDVFLDISAIVDQIFTELENESGFLSFDDFRNLIEKKSKCFKMLTTFTD